MIILYFIGLYLMALGLSTSIILVVLIKQFINFSNSIEGKDQMTYWDIRVPRFFMFVAMRIIEASERMDTKSY